MWPVFNILGLEVPTYLVINSLVFCISIVWISRRAQRAKLSANQSLDLCFLGLLAAFVGARAFHVFYEQPQIYLSRPHLIFKIVNGGFVDYGGAFTAFFTIYFYCQKREIEVWKYADVFAPVLAFGYAFGRLGCFAAGCCFGKPTSMPWGVVFPPWVEAPSNIPLHPTQLYFFILEGMTGFLLLFLEKKPWFKKAAGRVFGLWLILHGVTRTVIEVFRGDFRGPTLLGLSISTWLSTLVLALGLSLIFPNLKRSILTRVR